jgi:hypothetical protein
MEFHPINISITGNAIALLLNIRNRSTNINWIIMSAGNRSPKNANGHTVAGLIHWLR